MCCTLIKAYTRNNLRPEPFIKLHISFKFDVRCDFAADLIVEPCCNSDIIKNAQESKYFPLQNKYKIFTFVSAWLARYGLGALLILL